MAAPWTASAPAPRALGAAAPRANRAGGHARRASLARSPSRARSFGALARARAAAGAEGDLGRVAAGALASHSARPDVRARPSRPARDRARRGERSVRAPGSSGAVASLLETADDDGGDAGTRASSAPSSIPIPTSTPASAPHPPTGVLAMSASSAALRVGSPVMAMGLLRSAFNLTDAYWAGALGPAHLSALCYNAFALWLVALACSVVATGVQARVSALAGAGDASAVSKTVVQGLWGALGTYALMLLVSPLVPALYASGLGIEPGTAAHEAGRAHLNALIAGSAGLAASSVLEAAFRGLGKTGVALTVTCATVAIAAVLDPMLMLGAFGAFPRLGLAGAAVGSAIAAAIGAGLFWRALERTCGVKLRYARPDAGEIWKMVKVGLPMASSGAVFTLVSIAMGRAASACGEHHLAGMGLGQKVEAVAFTVCEGFRLACATLVGQWLGYGDARKAREAHAVSSAMCVVAMAPFAVALFFFGEAVASRFGADPAVVAAAGTYLRWNSGALLFLAVEAVVEGAFTGVGNTVPVLAFGAACNVARVPLAYALATGGGWGIHGVWAAVVSMQVAKGVLKRWYFDARVMKNIEEREEAKRRKGGGEGGTATRARALA